MLTHALGAPGSQEWKPCLTLALPVKTVFHPHLTGNPERGLRGRLVRWLTDVIKDQVFSLLCAIFSVGSTFTLVSRWSIWTWQYLKEQEARLFLWLSRGMVCFLAAPQQTPLEL